MLAEVLRTSAQLAAAEAARTLALAAAGHLALDVMADRRANNRASEMALHEVTSELAAAENLSDRTSPLPWDRVVTHPVTGAVLHIDSYHRGTAIDRFLRARDRHCRWPGCTVPAIRAEVDHTHDDALGGATEVSNLAHLCQRHHTQKQFTRWRVRQVPGGVLEWTSPTGRIYTDEPLAYSPAVRFVPDDPPPPEPEEQPAPF